MFVTAGLGGGTGSGAAPIVAAKAKEQGALTIGVVTKPFDFEGVQRREIADDAAARLLAEVDALITVPNERVDGVIRQDASALEAFRVVDEVLLQAAEGIIDLLNTPGLINLDFADVRAVVQDAGPALIGIGRGFGPDRATDAARQAISSPLLEASIKGARGILFHVSGPPDLRLREVRLAADEIRAAADPRANVIFGANLSGDAEDEVLITLIATGLDPNAVGNDVPVARPATADEQPAGRPSVPAENPLPIASHREFAPEPPPQSPKPRVDLPAGTKARARARASAQADAEAGSRGAINGPQHPPPRSPSRSSGRRRPRAADLPAQGPTPDRRRPLRPISNNSALPDALTDMGRSPFWTTVFRLLFLTTPEIDLWGSFGGASGSGPSRSSSSVVARPARNTTCSSSWRGRMAA